jgi:methylated-DNA-[protein]-cysteine S-methyltransferase
MTEHRTARGHATDSDIEMVLRTGPNVDIDLDALAATVARRADEIDLLDIAYARTDSPVGELTVAATPLGIVALGWDTDELLAKLAAGISPRILERADRLDEARRQLDAYFSSRHQRLDLPIDWSLARGFRRTVLEELATTSPGDVVTYGELAERVHNPKASRAVGSAMATNPIPIVVPCHRVVRSGGGLGNYGGAGGVVTKQWLLDHERGD